MGAPESQLSGAGGGAARAGGLGLIAAADASRCGNSTSATFAFTEVRLERDPGRDLGDGAAPRLAHRAAAGRLFLTGDTFNGVHAARVGLVTAAVADDLLDETG